MSMLKKVVLRVSELACTLPEKVGRGLVYSMGIAASQLCLRTRQELFERIDRVYHRLNRVPPMPVKTIVTRIFLHFSLNLYEVLRMPLVSESYLEDAFTFHGSEHFEAALAAKKGVILLVPHLGNWELLGSAIAHRGFSLHSFYLAQKENDIGSLLDHFRGYSRIVLHDRDRGGIGALKALKKGEVLGMIADQDGGSHAIYADFLGHWVSIPAGPANWSLKTGVKVVPLYSLRRGNSRRFDAYYFPALADEDTSSGEDPMIRRTRKTLQWMESVILDHPDQYLWFYDRFKPRHEGHLARLKGTGAKMRHANIVYGN